SHHHPYPHSFPTRRSSDLENLKALKGQLSETKAEVDMLRKAYYIEDDNMERYLTLNNSIAKLDKQFDEFSEGLDSESISYTELRSEEHTSELQSRFDLVCR